MSHLGVVVVHGLGGTPHSVMPITAAVHAAGHSTAAPLLPGHGTSPDDLVDRSWTEWSAAVMLVCDEMSARRDGIVIVGQSLGGTLALVAASMRSDVRGVATINALALPPDPDATEHLEYLIGRGRTMQPAGEPDLRDPAAHDSGYPELALTALVELGRASAAAHDVLGDIDVPVFIASSAHDGVVDPVNSEAIADGVGGPVTRLVLPNSAHVAALDLDRNLLCEELLRWLADLTDGSAEPA